MQIAGRKVLVTGGAGFIGSHLVEDLVRRGAEVTVYDDFSSGLEENLAAVKGEVRVLRGSILDRRALRRAARGQEIVSHQAAQLEITRCIQDPAEDLESNTGGTLNVLEAARRAGAGLVVNASSACVYGQAVHTPSREDRHPTDPN